MIRGKNNISLTINSQLLVGDEQPQYNMNFIYISDHLIAREDKNSTN